MSYTGSLRRVLAWIKRTGEGGTGAAVLAWTGGVLFLLLAWWVISAWYFFTIVIFGWLLIPFRLIRRGQRKQAHLQSVQLATMQAMAIQQQATLANRPMGNQPLQPPR